MSIAKRKLILERVIGSKSQIAVLFQILKRRTHNISNTVLPSVSEHREFVCNHPYRAWYIIKLDSGYIGTTYVMANNCVSVSLISDIEFTRDILIAILKRHKPLKEIKSVRPGFFYINISPDNFEMEKQLKISRFQKIQSTFALLKH